MGNLTVWGHSSLVDVVVSIITAVVTCLSISGLIANAMLIVSVLKQPSLRRSPTYVTLASLAASDFLALLSTPLIIYLMFTAGLDSTVCLIFIYAYATAFTSGANHIMLFSILRYIILVKPLVSMKYLTVKNTLWMCVAIWSISFTINIPGTFKMELVSLNTSYNASVLVCVQTVSMVDLIFVAITFGAIPLTVMAIFHILKAYQLCKRTVQPVNGGQTDQVSTKIIAGILISFVISFLPALIYWGILFLSENKTMEDLGIGYIMYVCGYINNAINPLFYFFLSNRVRKKSGCFGGSPVNKDVQGRIPLQSVCT